MDGTEFERLCCSSLENIYPRRRQSFERQSVNDKCWLSSLKNIFLIFDCTTVIWFDWKLSTCGMYTNSQYADWCWICLFPSAAFFWWQCIWNHSTQKNLKDSISFDTVLAFESVCCLDEDQALVEGAYNRGISDDTGAEYVHYSECICTLINPWIVILDTG